MKKPSAWILIIVSSFFVLGFFYYMSSELRSIKARKNNVLELLTLHLLTMDSLTFEIPELVERKMVLIHFNSECGHCHNEMMEIEKHLIEFKKVNIILFSSEPLQKIESFQGQYLSFLNHPNIYFTKINPENVAPTFGSLAVPHIFIYGADGYLTKEFKGETKVEAILKHLNSK